MKLIERIVLVVLLAIVIGGIFISAIQVYPNIMPVLLYHDVKNTTYFTAQMQYIYSQGYTTLSATQLIAWYDGKLKNVSRPIVITFDDGYASLKDVYPILKQYKMRAIVFPIMSVMEKQTPDTHITLDELFSMQDVYDIGSHSYNLHGTVEKQGKYVNVIDAVSLLNFYKDIRQSQKVYPTNIYAYPHGSYSYSKELMLKLNGYLLAFTVDNNSCAIWDGNMYAIPRISVSEKMNLAPVLEKCTLGVEK